jgi:hypothetical protein
MDENRQRPPGLAALQSRQGMFRQRIRSALYIDFENIPLPPESIGNWLDWLEDGVFDPSGRRRKYLQKRVYWNSHAERHRDLFEAHGFEAILVGKFSGLKNSADIRMAMDVVETTYARPEIKEFILLTGDSDFVPVLERLRHKTKATAVVVTEHRPNIHTTYNATADFLIPSRLLAEAASYQRPRRRLLERLFGRGASPSQRDRPPTSARGAAPPPRPVKTAASIPALNGRTAIGLEGPGTRLDEAAQRVATMLVAQPRNYVSQKRIMAELDKVAGFKRSGPAALFGESSYRTLMVELARRDPRIRVVNQPGGGTGVVYVPPSTDATIVPAGPRLKLVAAAVGLETQEVAAPFVPKPSAEADRSPSSAAAAKDRGDEDPADSPGAVLDHDSPINQEPQPRAAVPAPVSSSSLIRS